MLGVINGIRVCFRNTLSAATRANGRTGAGGQVHKAEVTCRRSQSYRGRGSEIQKEKK